MFDGVRADMRYVIRMLRKSPGFTLVAVVSLAIGIGANVSMFGVVRTLLLRPLPVDAPDELRLAAWRIDGNVQVYGIGSTDYPDPTTGMRYRSNFSYPIVRALAETAPSGVDVFSFAFLRGFSVGADGQAAYLAGGAFADGRYFSALRVPMALGRPIVEADDVRGAPLVAVLAYDFWQRAFGGDPEVVGRSIRVNGEAVEVVGVSARGFTGLSMGGFFPQTEITLPVTSQPRVYPRLSDTSLFTSDDVLWLRVMARVADGVSLTATERAFEVAMRSVPSPLLEAEDGPRVRLLEGAQGAQPVQASVGRLLLLLLGVVGIVLLIACVNLASLMLARGASREREIAVRRALGCGRARLARLTLLESVVLAGAGTAAGVFLAYATRPLLGDLLTSSLGTGAFGEMAITVDIDPTLIAAGALMGLAATLVFGLAPALRLSGLDPVDWLRNRTAGPASSRFTVGRALIALQIAVSVPLVVGAALFLRTVSGLASVELGFEPRGLVTFPVDPGFTSLDEAEYPDLYLSILSAVESVPGVRSATLVENALLSGIVSNGSLEVDGERHFIYRNAVGPGYRETMGVELVSGRMPGLQDAAGAPRVGVVNETAVHELYGGASPLGRRIGSPGDEIEIIGVIGDTPYRNQRDPVPPTLFESALQRPGWQGHNVLLRTDVPPARLETAIRDAVAGIDPDIPVPTLRAQTDIIAQATARERVFTRILTLFGGFALLLASIGLYGVTAYSVERRTSELGVRVAVGARPGQILASVLRQVVTLAAIGILVGVPLALTASPLVASLMYGVAPTDPVSLGGAAAVMLVVAIGAGLLPALRASRLDPLEALRAD